LLLVADIQGSATYWCRVRDDAGIQPSVFSAQKFGRVDSEVVKLERKFDDIIIDSGGRDSEELRSAMLAAHVFYIPITPSQFDLWSLTPMVSMVQKASILNPGLKTRVILNRASTHPTVTETQDAVQALKELDAMALSAAVIRERISFRKAVREGMSVTEIKNPDSRAIEEIETLYQEVFHE
jgi:chromosome partitioning protein